jgi:hypothetical protein
MKPIIASSTQILQGSNVWPGSSLNMSKFKHIQIDEVQGRP